MPGLERPTDIGAILEALLDHDVEFLVVGGVAAQIHGNPRMTLDLDVIPNPAEVNMERLAAALRDMEATASEESGRALPLDLSNPTSLAIGDYSLLTKHGRLDLLNGPRPDLKRYRRLESASIEANHGDLEVLAVGLDDLIAMKRKAGRAKDLEDIAALTTLERLMREDPDDGE
jgi:hypothetical protein